MELNPVDVTLIMTKKQNAVAVNASQSIQKN